MIDDILTWVFWEGFLAGSVVTIAVYVHYKIRRSKGSPWKRK